LRIDSQHFNIKGLAVIKRTLEETIINQVDRGKIILIIGPGRSVIALK